ncbi:dnaJ homolog subfamily C member 4-like isoform X7 [Mercenaria mercenaria]|uniref:dnaJ homolog subfamily C member 4-like isoform X7 n=1 Tax=Mercenaria mercenaria TaxID=6596 RepID=UPI00234F1BA3|nr:dnaJ homolog subfamily C member 4-like isoform X7 [Mercenaria mercenaria]
MKVTDIKQNTSMLFNITLCKACLQRLVATNKFVRLKSHYAVLGVSNTATQKQIRDAYLKLSKQHHPDQNRQDPKSHEKFVKINEAYEVLSKDSSRRSYDDSVRVRNQPRPNFRTSHRPPNYYSSGQFYEDQGPFSDHNQYDPYSKRNAGSHYDPFSSYGYEHYQRQRVYDDTPRRRIIPEDTFAYFQVVTLITLVLCSIRENYRQRRRNKQEIERRKQLKEQKSADKTKVYSKVTVGKDSS